MAKRVRDNHAEYLQRNVLAKLRGHGTRAKERTLIENGTIAAVQPNRVRAPKTVAAQAKRLIAPKTTPPNGGQALLDWTDSERFKSFGVPEISLEDQALDWSRLFAGDVTGTYNPQNAKALGVTEKEYTIAYINAFVKGDNTRYSAVRHNDAGGSKYLYYWFVTLNHYYASEVYEGRYGEFEE